MAQNAIKQAFTLQLKGRLFTLTVLSLQPCQIEVLREQLTAACQQAPNLLNKAPIVLDLQAFKGASFDLKGVVTVMREVGLVPVAVQHASVVQQKAAHGCGLGALSAREANASPAATMELAVPPPAEPSLTTERAPSACPAKLVSQPIRSGQQVYAKGGDLVVMAGVGAGAEVIADGHIHIYGPLRGRALAGAQGDSNARIFCRDLQAELVSIAGQYKMLDTKTHTHGATQVWLDDERIHIAEL